MGVLKDHLRMEGHALATNLFPGSDGVRPMAALLA